jgi:drug/metabolite transporter (DMT)-like permease
MQDATGRPPRSATRQAALDAAMPILFVLLWSTGFIGSKLGLPYAEPLTFLALRFVAAGAVLTLVAFASGAPWPHGRTLLHAGITGLLVQGVYLGGVFEAIYHGMAAGLAALIVCLQPLITACLAAPLLGERVTARQWLGLVLGLAGTALVLFDRLGGGIGDEWAMLFAGAALAGITVGTLHQKKFGGATDLRTGTATQYLLCAIVFLAIAPFAETMRVAWMPSFIFALAWLVVMLSVGAVTIYYWLIRHGTAAKVTSLMYLVPAVTALMAAFLGERLGLTAIAGMAMVAIAVILVNR